MNSYDITASTIFYDHLTDHQREEIIRIVKPYTNFSSEWVSEVRKLLWRNTVCPVDGDQCWGCVDCGQVVVIDDERFSWNDDCIPLIISFIDDHFFEEDPLISSMSISEDDSSDGDDDSIALLPIPMPSTFRHHDLFFRDEETGCYVLYTGPETISTIAKLVVVPPRGDKIRESYYLDESMKTFFTPFEQEENGTLHCHVNAPAMRALFNREEEYQRQIAALDELVEAVESRKRFLKFMHTRKKGEFVPNHLKHYVGQPDNTLPTMDGSTTFIYTVKHHK